MREIQPIGVRMRSRTTQATLSFAWARTVLSTSRETRRGIVFSSIVTGRRRSMDLARLRSTERVKQIRLPLQVDLYRPQSIPIFRLQLGFKRTAIMTLRLTAV